MLHGFNMERLNPHNFAIFIVFSFLLCSTSPLISAQESTTLSSTIHTNWLGENNHGYLIKFDRAPSAEELGEIVVNSTHIISEQERTSQQNHSWGNGLGIIELNEYSILLSDSISYGDQVEIKVFLNNLIIENMKVNPSRTATVRFCHKASCPKSKIILNS